MLRHSSLKKELTRTPPKPWGFHLNIYSIMYNDIKIGVLIPTRGDRPNLLNFVLGQLDKQTVKPDVVEIMNDAPLNSDKDITWRYRIGCDRITSKKVDVIFLIEDDDYYHEGYIESMINEWIKSGKPEIFGIGETIYYHLAIKGYNKMIHPTRSSAFCTMFTKDGIKKMKWPKDNFPFTDIELWKQLQGKTFVPEKTITIGIKGHKNGILFGGIGHRTDTKLYKTLDTDLNWLKSKMDENSFEFYKKIEATIR